jgi:hypothetical protein
MGKGRRRVLNGRALSPLNAASGVAASRQSAEIKAGWNRRKLSKQRGERLNAECKMQNEEAV